MRISHESFCVKNASREIGGQVPYAVKTKIDANSVFHSLCLKILSNFQLVLMSNDYSHAADVKIMRY